jgi:hypothetical protein
VTISSYKANEGREGDMLVCVCELEAHCWVFCVNTKGHGGLGYLMQGIY